MNKVTIILCLISLCGCSVGMAMSGEKEPNLGALRVGSSRGEIEMHLGPPTTSTTTEDGLRIDVYEYEIGNSPSGGRAIGHAIMDVLTIGLWEIIGTPIEGFQGEKRALHVTYDSTDHVKSLTGPAP